MPRPNRGPSLTRVPGRDSYYIVWFERGARRLRSTGTGDQRQAEKALQAFIGQSHRPASGPREPHEITVAEVLDIYGTLHAPKVADPVRIASAIDALLPHMGRQTIAQVTPSSCDQYARDRGKAPATVRRELTTLRAAMNFAVRNGNLTRPAPIAMPAKPEGEDRWLTVSELARLLNAARTARKDVRLYLPLFILIAFYTGARKEAVLSLTWAQIDMERRRIDFRRGRARTNKGRALLPIPDRLYTFLRYAWLRRTSDIGPVVHDRGKAIKDIGASWTGGTAPPQGSFGRACKAAGLPNVTPHTLRHTRATWMAQAGVDMWQIAGWLAQSLASTTELYSHHHPDFMAVAKRAADRR